MHGESGLENGQIADFDFLPHGLEERQESVHDEGDDVLLEAVDEGAIDKER